MGKRAGSHAPKSPKRSRRAKTDPVLTGISRAIMEFDELPKQVREMLSEMLPFSLGVPADERHESQTWVVNTVEQTLNNVKASLQVSVASETVKLDQLKLSGVELERTTNQATSALEAQKEATRNAEAAEAAAREAMHTASIALKAAQAEQKEGDKTLASTQEDKTSLESAFAAHFEAPMQEGNGPDLKELKHSLKLIEIDNSLQQALPASCAKSKDERGSFDLVILEEFRKALTSKISALGAAEATELPASRERANAVQIAETDHEAKKETHRQCLEAWETAKKELVNREAELNQACQALCEFQPQVDALTEAFQEAKESLDEFETGPLSNFMTYKTRVAPSPEAAPAGA